MLGERVRLVDWSTHAENPEAIGEALLALRMRDGAEVFAGGHTHLLRLPAESFQGAAWALIEAHGVVMPLDVPGDGPVPREDWRECWRHRGHDPVSNHQRVPMTGGPTPPHAPRALSSNPATVFAGLLSCRRQNGRTSWKKRSTDIGSR